MKPFIAKSGLGTEVPPELSHVKIYFQQKNVSETEAELFYNYYDKLGWKNKNGNLIKSWKTEANDWIWVHNAFRKFIGKCLNNHNTGFKRGIH